MRVVVVGTVVSNGGDAAILDAEVDLVRRAWPGAEVAVHDSAPDVARRLFPALEVHPVVDAAIGSRRSRRGSGRLERLDRRRVMVAARLARRRPGLAGALVRGRERASWRSLVTADVVAHTGGTTLIEKYPLAPKLYELELAGAAGAAVVLLPQSLGPFTRPDVVPRVRRVVGTAALVLLRDDRSKEHLAMVGASTERVRVVPDVVFALGAPAGEERLRTAEVPARPRVAVSVRDCSLFLDGAQGQARFERAVAGLVEHLVTTRGARVTFVSTCQGVPEYWADDSRVAVTVRDLLPPALRDSVVVDREHHDHAGLTRLLARHDVAVTTRMHAGIIALGAGTPVLPVAYEFKTTEVMGQVGLGDHVQDVGAVTAASLSRGFDELVARLPQLRPSLADSLQLLRTSARDLEDQLRAVLVAGARAGHRGRGASRPNG